MSTSSSPASGQRLSLIVVLLTMAAAGVALCAVIVAPFVSGLVWALAFAIVAEPLRQWLAARFRPTLMATLGVTIAATVAILGILQRRTTHARSAEQPT